MNLDLKNYRALRIKHYLKKSPILVVYHTPRLRCKKLLLIEQDLKKLGLVQYKVANSAISRITQSSIYRNFTTAISGTVTILKLQSNTEEILMETLIKKFHSIFVCLFLKLNNKIYEVNNTKYCDKASYKQIMSTFNASLNVYFKSPYSWSFKNSK